MKLRNKKTGEIVDYISFKAGGGQISMYVFDTNKHYYYNSLAELNEEWEDMLEEPEVIYYLSWDGVVLHSPDKTGWQDAKQIGNYFESEEEAEKAVEKLKAIRRLKDKGLEVTEWVAGLGDDNYKIGEVMVGFDIDGVYDGNVPEDIEKDLDLLFGGEE